MNLTIRNISKPAHADIIVSAVAWQGFKSTNVESSVESQVISLDLLRCCGLSAVGQLALCTRLWASVRELLPKALVVALHRLNSSYWWNNLELGMIHFLSSEGANDLNLLQLKTPLLSK